MNVSEYLKTAFSYQREVVDELCAVIKWSKVEFDSIAVRGVSGIVVGSAIAYKLGKPLIVIRKLEENSHRHVDVENDNEGSFIIVDDFISTGLTVNEIYRAVKSSDLRGVFLYSGHHYDDISVRKNHKGDPKIIPVYGFDLDEDENFMYNNRIKNLLAYAKEQDQGIPL